MKVRVGEEKECPRAPKVETQLQIRRQFWPRGADAAATAATAQTVAAASHTAVATPLVEAGTEATAAQSTTKASRAAAE